MFFFQRFNGQFLRCYIVFSQVSPSLAFINPVSYPADTHPSTRNPPDHFPFTICNSSYTKILRQAAVSLGTGQEPTGSAPHKSLAPYPPARSSARPACIGRQKVRHKAPVHILIRPAGHRSSRKHHHQFLSRTTPAAQSLYSPLRPRPAPASSTRSAAAIHAFIPLPFGPARLPQCGLHSSYCCFYSF